MFSYVNYALFGVYPYLCLTVFLAGSLIRFDREQYSWKSYSSQLLRRRQMIWGSNLFHVGILVILAGHTGGLLTPIQVWGFLGVSHTAKQLLAMIVGGLAGVACFVGLTMLLHRRLFDSRIRKTSNPSDIAVLVILYVQLILGISTIFVSAGHLDGEEMVKLMNWAQSIVTLRAGAAGYVADVLGMTIFLIFPFTRLVHIWSVPVWYFGRRGYQIVRTKRSPEAVRRGGLNRTAE
jgi:nitrate reductase gamma subunit